MQMEVVSNLLQAAVTLLGFACRKALLAPLFGVPLCMFYCTFGDVLSNLLWCGMMIIVSCFSIRGLAYARRQRELQIV